ncbi:MAG: chemotaxis response regulator protein-glutamate methylesterase, partial [Caulobacter sp. 35-67-4]
MIKLLIVDDSALMRRVLGEVFQAEPDFEVAFARDGGEALASLSVFKPDVVTLDVHMPRMSGLECLDQIMIEHPCPVVMISSLTTDGAEATLDALALGAVDFVSKPAGTVSLALDEFAPLVLEKVRAAAGVRLPRAYRLSERLRARRPPAPLPLPRAAPPAAAAGSLPSGVFIIGTSTGGPPALDTVLSALPADFPWPILVAQHMPAA